MRSRPAPIFQWRSNALRDFYGAICLIPGKLPTFCKGELVVGCLELAFDNCHFALGELVDPVLDNFNREVAARHFQRRVLTEIDGFDHGVSGNNSNRDIGQLDSIENDLRVPVEAQERSWIEQDFSKSVVSCLDGLAGFHALHGLDAHVALHVVHEPRPRRDDELHHKHEHQCGHDPSSTEAILRLALRQN